MIMSFLFFAGATLAGLASTKTAASVLVGAQFLEDRVYRRKTEREHELNLNPAKNEFAAERLRKFVSVTGGDPDSVQVVDDWTLLNIPEENLPEKYKYCAGKHLLTVEEAEVFLLALEHVCNGGAVRYSFEWMTEVSARRKDDPLMGSVLTQLEGN